MPESAFIIRTPSSVVSTGASGAASIGAFGRVQFTSCATLQINGIFSSLFDNYMLVMRISGSASNDALYLRFASGGTTTTDSNYTYQYISVLSTTVGAGRFGSQTAARIGNSDNEHRGGDAIFVFGPFLSQPTAIRNVHVYGEAGAGIVEFVSTHTTASSYDGIWLQSGSGTITGTITVYGCNQ